MQTKIPIVIKRQIVIIYFFIASVYLVKEGFCLQVCLTNLDKTYSLSDQ